MIPSSQSVSRFAKVEPNRSRLLRSQTFSPLRGRTRALARRAQLLLAEGQQLPELRSGALAKPLLTGRSSCRPPQGPYMGACSASLSKRLDLFPCISRPELLPGPFGALHGRLLSEAGQAPRPEGSLSGFQGSLKAYSAKLSSPMDLARPVGFASQTWNRALLPLGQPSYAQPFGRSNRAGGQLAGLLRRSPARFAVQAKIEFRASASRTQLGRLEGPRNRFMVNSYRDGIDPTTDEPLNTGASMRPLLGVSNQPELGRQLPNKADEQETRTIVITSGKGGVGKTTTTANLGMSIARLGYRVALIDADIGLRNLDLLLGLENRVLYTAMDIFEGDCRLDQALIRDKRLKNLCLLAISKNRQRYNVTRQKMDTLIASISALGYHFILIDCPAGIDIGFINAISPAQEALIVTTPEITAMRDADRVAGLLEANGIYNAKLLINRVRPDMIQRHNMTSVQDVQDVLGIPLLGAIPEDLNVIISTNRGEPLVLRKKLTLSGIAFENAARRLIGRSDYLIDLKTPYKGIFQKMKTLFFNNR